jgi:hypothetical protein
MMKVTETAGAVAAVVAAGAGILATVRMAVRNVMRIARFLEAWFGTEGDPVSGHPRVPGVMERLEAIQAAVNDHNARLVAIEEHLSRQDITQ